MSETPKQEKTQAAGAASGCNDLLGGMTAIENLHNNQQQADMDGVMVTVSKQALDEALAELERRADLIEAMDERMEGEGLDRCQKCGTFAQVQRFVAGHPCQDVCIGCQVTPNAGGKRAMSKERSDAAKSPLDRLVMWLWSIAWRKWMLDSRGNRLTVVNVKGWRTAIVESKWESRKTITPCFSILGIKFE